MCFTERSYWYSSTTAYTKSLEGFSDFQLRRECLLQTQLGIKEEIENAVAYSGILANFDINFSFVQ